MYIIHILFCINYLCFPFRNPRVANFRAGMASTSTGSNIPSSFFSSPAMEKMCREIMAKNAAEAAEKERQFEDVDESPSEVPACSAVKKVSFTPPKNWADAKEFVPRNLSVGGGKFALILVS